MADFITGGLPDTVNIDETEYSIRTDYRVWIKFDKISRSNGKEEEKLLNLLQLCYPVIPTNLEKAITQMLWFYRCGEKDEVDRKEDRQRYSRRESMEPAYSFVQDAPYIYSAFLEQYGINLSSPEKIHWWKFMALFESLSENTKMSKIMYYRKVSTSGMDKSRRAFVNEMKKLYKIRDGYGNKMTLEQRNQKWITYVNERFKKG